MTPGFDRLFFGDLEPAKAIALNQRIRQEDRPRVVLVAGGTAGRFSAVIPGWMGGEMGSRPVLRAIDDVPEPA